LGVFVFIDGMLSDTIAIPELVFGMVMVGILPIDNLFDIRIGRHHSKEKE